MLGNHKIPLAPWHTGCSKKSCRRRRCRQGRMAFGGVEDPVFTFFFFFVGGWLTPVVSSNASRSSNLVRGAQIRNCNNNVVFFIIYFRVGYAEYNRYNTIYIYIVLIIYKLLNYI